VKGAPCPRATQKRKRKNGPRKNGNERKNPIAAAPILPAIDVGISHLAPTRPTMAQRVSAIPTPSVPFRTIINRA
jgi:hypothetical protein